MNRYYLTEIIYIQDNIMYIQGKKIHTNNWHHILKDYGWGKLPLQWIKKLNKLADSKTKNSRVGVRLRRRRRLFLPLYSECSK